MINWNDIDLTSCCERELDIIDPLSFKTLLLEIQCNIRDINPATITAQFEEDLQSRIEEARSVFESNLDNILAYALAERNED